MVMMLVTAVLVLSVDLVSKYFAQIYLTAERITAIPGLLSLQLRHNSGIALGMFEGNIWAMLVLPVVMILIGWRMLRKFEPTGFIRFTSGLILGGFAGNYAERLLQGYVVDMIYFPFMPWFVCNVADVAVCIGVGLMIISLLFRPQDWREKNATVE